MDRARSGIVITVFSTASAVGKTLISINMAAELAHEGNRVCLVDLDLQFGDVCNYLKLQPAKTIANAQKAAERETEAFDPMPYLTDYSYKGVKFSVLAGPLELAEAYNISPLTVSFIVKQLQYRFDYLVLDTTSTFSELNLSLLDMGTIITFLGIVDFIPTIKNMKSGCDTIRSMGYDANKIRLVLNRSNSKTRIDLEDVEQLLGEPFYHVLPNDFVAAQQSIQMGVPLVLSSQSADLARELRNLVGRYTNHVLEPSETEHGVSSWFKKFFNK